MRVIAREQPAAGEALQQVAAYGGLAVMGSISTFGRPEDDAPSGRGLEDAVEYHAAKMQMGIEHGPEAVDEGRPSKAHRGVHHTPSGGSHGLRHPCLEALARAVPREVLQG